MHVAPNPHVTGILRFSRSRDGFHAKAELVQYKAPRPWNCWREGPESSVFSIRTSDLRLELIRRLLGLSSEQGNDGLDNGTVVPLPKVALLIG